MSARASAKRREIPSWDGTPLPVPRAVDEMLETADRIERAAQEIQALNAVLKLVDRNITAAAKQAVKRAGSWPLRLNSRQAKRMI